MISPEIDAQADPAQTGAAERVELPSAWRGELGLSIVASDETGAAIPGVSVVLRLEGSPQVLQGLQTDAQGRLEIEGMAPGEWQVDLQRDGFMLYTAYLKLEGGRQPEVAFSSRQRTGSYWAPLNAAFLSPGTRATPEVRTGRATAKQARKESERREREARQAERRAERRQRQEDAARVVDEPVVEIRPAPVAEEPASEVEPAEPAETVEPIASQRSAPESASSKSREPVPTDPEPGDPAATDASDVVETVATDDLGRSDDPGRADDPGRSDAVSPPRLLPNPRLLSAGPCVECQPGEWSVRTERSASGAVGTCTPPPAARLEEVAQLVGSALRPEVRGFAGSLIEDDANDVRRLLAEEDRERLDRLLAPVVGDSSCPVLGLVLPADARYVGFRTQAGERSVMAECPLGQECQIGQASWSQPLVIDTEAGRVVFATFENRSGKARVGRLTVYFAPARGWLPPTGSR